MLADNERYLRELTFIKDVRLIIDEIPGIKDSIDIIVITKDVFSIGGNVDINKVKRAELELREENFRGSGTKISFAGLGYKLKLTTLFLTSEIPVGVEVQVPWNIALIPKKPNAEF